MGRPSRTGPCDPISSQRFQQGSKVQVEPPTLSTSRPLSRSKAADVPHSSRATGGLGAVGSPGVSGVDPGGHAASAGTGPARKAARPSKPGPVSAALADGADDVLVEVVLPSLMNGAGSLPRPGHSSTANTTAANTATPAAAAISQRRRCDGSRSTSAQTDPAPTRTKRTSSTSSIPRWASSCSP